MKIKALWEHIFSKPIAYWFGVVGAFEYEIQDDCLIQKSSTGKIQNLCLVNEIEYWSDDCSLKIVTFGLKNGRRIIVKDGAGKLALLLTNSPLLVQRRD
jgi:hypothetical protein